MDDSGPSDSDNEINQTQHSNLLAAVSQLDAKQRVKPPSRKETSFQVSEFHLVKGNNNKNTVKISSLTKVLGQRGSHAEITKKLRSVRQKAKTLPRPLEKPVAAKIQRKVGFQNVKHNLGRWNAVVYSNRATDQLKFPLKQSTVEFQTTDDFVSKLKSQDRTLLEAEMDEILNSSPVVQEERKAEEEYQLTLAEMIEHRREMAKLRAQQSYMASKANRQNKIKSKKYHRLQRRERTRQQLKDFEMLQKTDPEAALKQLDQLERTRAEERVSLRHRSTGQWARNKVVRAKYDQESRQELAQQLAISRDLTQKIQTENSSDEEEEENNVTEIPSNRDNPWIAPKATNEVEEFVSGYRKYWEERTKKSKENISTHSVALSKIEIDKEDKLVNNSKKEPEKNVTLSFVNKNSEDKDSVNSEVDQVDSCGVGKNRIESMRETEISENHIEINKSSDDENSNNCEEDEADFCEVDEDSIESNTVNILENHVGNSLNKNSDDEANDSCGEDEADNFEVDMVGIKKDINMTEVAKNLILNSTNISSEDENDDNSARDEEFSKRTNMKSVNNNNTNKQIRNYVNKETTAQKKKLCRKINVSTVMSPIKLKTIDKSNKKRKRKASFNVAANGYESNLTAFATTNSWTVTQIDTSERKAKELDVSKKNNLKTERSDTDKIKTIDKTELLDMFDDVEEKLKKRVQKKLNKLKLDFKIKDSKTEERVSDSDDEGPSLKMRKETVRPELDEELIEQPHNDIPQQNIHSDINLNKRLAQSKIQESEAQTDNIDPNKFIAMKPKHLHTELPDMITLGDEGIDDNENDDLENKQQLTITEAFAEDDVVAEFRKEKEEAEEKSQPQNIDLTLPGWGEWAGKNLKLSARKKRHFIIKFPTVPPRKDANKGSLIINEEKNDKVRTHQVSELPFPFASVKDFEASIRAPIGNTWVPETAHRKLIKPPVITKLGTIIQPMDEDMLVNKNKILKGMP